MFEFDSHIKYDFKLLFFSFSQYTQQIAYLVYGSQKSLKPLAHCSCRMLILPLSWLHCLYPVSSSSVYHTAIKKVFQQKYGIMYLFHPPLLSKILTCLSPQTIYTYRYILPVMHELHELAFCYLFSSNIITSLPPTFPSFIILLQVDILLCSL